MLLNRCAILLTPKQPYVEWADSLDADGPRFSETEELEGPRAAKAAAERLLSFFGRYWDLHFPSGEQGGECSNPGSFFSVARSGCFCVLLRLLSSA
jgi:hypothetical protein